MFKKNINCILGIIWFFYLLLKLLSFPIIILIGYSIVVMKDVNRYNSYVGYINNAIDEFMFKLIGRNK